MTLGRRVTASYNIWAPRVGHRFQLEFSVLGADQLIEWLISSLNNGLFDRNSVIS